MTQFKLGTETKLLHIKVQELIKRLQTNIWGLNCYLMKS